MTIRIIRDVTDECRMPADTVAVIALCPNIYGTVGEGCQEYAFAGGEPAAQLYSGIRPFGWSQDDNTVENWVDWYDTLEEAEAAFAAVI